MQLCDGFGLPLLFLCDTPGFMVGPAAERTATVRHFSRMFVTGANLSVPAGTVVLRKGYGLGAQAMAAGSFKAPLFTIGWPTSEFGGMGLEGAVRLGMRRELEAIADARERDRAFAAMVAAAYERGRGISMAEYGEIDDVIDPADTRRWLELLFEPRPDQGWRGATKRRPHIDTW
jgi:acetyl-CoA carboxylase carboxyltransferase component